MSNSSSKHPKSKGNWPPAYVYLTRPLIRPLFRGIFHTLFDVEIQGRENIPQKGAYLVAFNHVSRYDPPFVLAFWPRFLEAAGAADVRFRPMEYFWVRMYGVLPVQRSGYDRWVLENMVHVLQAGKPLMLSPEGTRSHRPGMQAARPGAAYVLSKINVPVIPVGVVGTTDDVLQRALKRERPHLEMCIGQPFDVPPLSAKGAGRKAARQQQTDWIMAHLAALLPEEYRGVYAE